MNRVLLLNLVEICRPARFVLAAIAILFLIELLLALRGAWQLRLAKWVPAGLADELRRAAACRSVFDPRPLWQLTIGHSSSAGRIVQAVLLKTGRPLAEIEHALDAALRREAFRLSAIPRRMSLLAVVTPLVGLIGAAGLAIAAFQSAANPLSTQAASSNLARGLAAALTPLAAAFLAAIPALLWTYCARSRILEGLDAADELVRALLPHFERFEHRVRAFRDPATGELKLEPRQPTSTETAIEEPFAL